LIDIPKIPGNMIFGLTVSFSPKGAYCWCSERLCPTENVKPIVGSLRRKRWAN
jgi:hypothetical protein